MLQINDVKVPTYFLRFCELESYCCASLQGLLQVTKRTAGNIANLRYPVSRMFFSAGQYISPVNGKDFCTKLAKLSSIHSRFAQRPRVGPRLDSAH